MHALRPAVTRNGAPPATLLPATRPAVARTEAPLSIGNQLRQRLLLQRKLTVNEPGDVFERQADRIADAVMRMPDPSRSACPRASETRPPAVQRMCAECGEELEESPPAIHRMCSECGEGLEERRALQAKELPNRAPEITPAVQAGIARLGGGRPLPASERAYFEPRFGRDLGHVRLHTDSAAAETTRMVQARAFTMGRDVVFGGGEYSPGTAPGRRLLAHELTHVLQQGAVACDARPSIQRQEPVTTGAAGITIGTAVGKCIVGAIGGVLFDAAIQAILYSIKEWTWRFWRASWDYCSLILSAAIGCIAAPISAATLEPWLAARLGPALGRMEGTLLGKLLLWLAEKLALAPPKFIVKSLAKLGCISPEQAAALGVQRGSPDEPAPPPVPLPPGPATPTTPTTAATTCKPLAGDVAGDARVLMKINTADLLDPEEEVKLDKFADSVRASGAKVKVHGLASTDGPADYNDRLSCTRALRAAQLLRERGVSDTQIIDVFKHGEVSGPYRWRRAAVFETEGAAPGGPPTPTGPPPTPSTPPPTAATMRLKGIHFTSDHGGSGSPMLKDSYGSWERTGDKYPAVEWQPTNPDEKSAPISHDMGKPIELEAALDMSGFTPGTPFTLRGDSPRGFLDFEASATASGAAEQVVSMRSKQALAPEIASHLNQTILWSVVTQNRRSFVGLSGGHDVFVTQSEPRKSDEVTYRRMSTAVRLAKGFGNDPHAIVRGQMERFKGYTFCPTCGFIGNVWPIADTMKGECQAIVRFVQAIDDMLGIPGVAEGVTIYAAPDAPDTPVHGALTEQGGPGMSNFPPDPATGLRAVLFDKSDTANNYEAALKFTHGNTKYYPGGLGGLAVDAELQVLHTFAKMSWARDINNNPNDPNWVPVTLIWCYRPPCH